MVLDYRNAPLLLRLLKKITSIVGLAAWPQPALKLPADDEDFKEDVGNAISELLPTFQIVIGARLE